MGKNNISDLNVKMIPGNCSNDGYWTFRFFVDSRCDDNDKECSTDQKTKREPKVNTLNGGFQWTRDVNKL